jgi:hypothetical protein
MVTRTNTINSLGLFVISEENEVLSYGPWSSRPPHTETSIIGTLLVTDSNVNLN